MVWRISSPMMRLLGLGALEMLCLQSPAVWSQFLYPCTVLYWYLPEFSKGCATSYPMGWFWVARFQIKPVESQASVPVSLKPSVIGMWGLTFHNYHVNEQVTINTLRQSHVPEGSTKTRSLRTNFLLFTRGAESIQPSPSEQPSPGRKDCSSVSSKPENL